MESLVIHFIEFSRKTVVIQSMASKHGQEKKKGSGTSIGCLFLSLGFLFCGLVFLFAFFTHARQRGPNNPFMAVVYGGGLTLLGLGGLAVVIAMMRGRK
jgi:hypothetical protein